MNTGIKLAKLASSLLLGIPLTGATGDLTVLNASYDPTRELYREVNSAFARQWQARTGERVTFRQSHSGSGKQARSVIDGLDADVVSLALAYDIDAIAQKGKLLPIDWQSRLPHNSCPYTSTIVFLVRKGNPKNIRDWDDLARPGVEVVTPNPKTSGGARWNYLAAWGYGLERFGNDESRTREFVNRIYRNVQVLDTGARGATTTFVQREIGDVLIAWENEALLAMRESGRGGVEIIRPTLSILAEPPVAWVDANVKRRGTEAVARAYLEFLYTPEGQDIAAKNYFRPRLESVGNKYKGSFPEMRCFTIQEKFGDWQKAHKRHFAEGGEFDRMLAGRR